MIARLKATASDVNCVVATFRDDFNTCDGRPQVIATGPDDGIDDSKYNEAGFSWMAARQIVLREVHAVKKRHSQLGPDTDLIKFESKYFRFEPISKLIKIL